MSRGLESVAGRQGGSGGRGGLRRSGSLYRCVPSGLILRVVYMGTGPWSGDIHGWRVG